MSDATRLKPRPVIRWHSGKWVLAPWIIGHFPKHRVYVEPFGGGASVLLRKPRSHGEVYNDLEGDIVNLSRILRDKDDSARLIDLLRLTPFAREEWKAAYLPDGDAVEAARRLVVRSFMGFGSDGWRTDLSTGFRANSNRSGNHAYLRFRRWAVGGVWDRIMAHVVADGEPTLAFACFDCTVARAHQKAAGARSSKPTM